MRRQISSSPGWTLGRLIDCALVVFTIEDPCPGCRDNETHSILSCVSHLAEGHVSLALKSQVRHLQTGDRKMSHWMSWRINQGSLYKRMSSLEKALYLLIMMIKPSSCFILCRLGTRDRASARHFICILKIVFR